MRSILEGDQMRLCAEGIQYEIAAMPPAGHVAALLEDLA